MDLAVTGPLARNARDLALALAVLGGANGDEGKAWTWRMPSPRHERLKDFRVGYVFDDASVGTVGTDIRALYDNVLSELSKAGATLHRGWPRGVDPRAHMKTFQHLLFALVTADASAEERERARRRMKTHPDDLMAAATAGPHACWLHETQRRLAFRALWQHYFQSCDVFLLPTTFTAAFPHDHTMPLDDRIVETRDGPRSYLHEMASWISFATVTGLPATVAPVGRTPDGLPAGVQIVAPMWEDGTSIEFAALLSDVVQGFTPPPAFQD